MRHSPTIGGISSVQKKLITSNVFSSFIVCKNLKRSALVGELLSNNSLFVGQLYKDKSLALRACNLIFLIQFTVVRQLTDRQLTESQLADKNWQTKKYSPTRQLNDKDKSPTRQLTDKSLLYFFTKLITILNFDFTNL